MAAAAPSSWNGSRVRGLTLLRPWDRAILLGPKDVENRPRRWGVPAAGLLVAVHAGHGWDALGESVIPTRWPGALDIPGWSKAAAGGGTGHAFPAGALVGLVWMFPPLELHQVAGRSVWATGPWCYPLGPRVQLARPVPCRGALGLWRVSPGLEEELVRAWVAAGHPAPTLNAAATVDDGLDLFPDLNP